MGRGSSGGGGGGGGGGRGGRGGIRIVGVVSDVVSSVADRVVSSVADRAVSSGISGALCHFELCSYLGGLGWLVLVVLEFGVSELIFELTLVFCESGRSDNNNVCLKFI